MNNRTEIPMTCPNCGKKIVRQVQWFKTNEEVTCECGTTIKIDSKELHEAVRAVDDLRKTLRRLK